MCEGASCWPAVTQRQTRVWPRRRMKKILRQNLFHRTLVPGNDGRPKQYHYPMLWSSGFWRIGYSPSAAYVFFTQHPVPKYTVEFSFVLRVLCANDEMYQLDAKKLWFIIISSLYMFRTSICPSSGVLYRLFTAAFGVQHMFVSMHLARAWGPKVLTLSPDAWKQTCAEHQMQQ